jgi:hypothetical protein
VFKPNAIAQGACFLARRLQQFVVRTRGLLCPHNLARQIFADDYFYPHLISIIDRVVTISPFLDIYPIVDQDIDGRDFAAGSLKRKLRNK